MYEDDNHETVAKTLWSETLIEVLCVALTKKKSDEQVVKLLREIKAKGFKPDYIVSKVTHDLDEAAARRVRVLLKQA